MYTFRPQDTREEGEEGIEGEGKEREVGGVEGNFIPHHQFLDPPLYFRIGLTSAPLN